MVKNVQGEQNHIAFYFSFKIKILANVRFPKDCLLSDCRLGIEIFNYWPSYIKFQVRDPL